MIGVIDDLLKFRFLLQVFETSVPVFGKSDGLLVFSWSWFDVPGQVLFVVFLICSVSDLLSVDDDSSGGVFDPR